MKKNDRLEALEGYLKETPDDPFLLYGIAIEYLNTDLEKGKTLLVKNVNVSGKEKRN